MRVLCLSDNPAQQWTDLRQSVMDRLKSENEALIKRLRELESSGAVVANGAVPRDDLVPRESWEVLDKEKKELEEVVKQKEKRLLRLQQVRVSSVRFFAVIDGGPSPWFDRCSPQRALSSEKP
jgi:mitotic spindle assembly checkpoint protein MAD1